MEHQQGVAAIHAAAAMGGWHGAGAGASLQGADASYAMLQEGSTGKHQGTTVMCVAAAMGT
jgi:hypothetical protein